MINLCMMEEAMGNWRVRGERRFQIGRTDFFSFSARSSLSVEYLDYFSWIVNLAKFSIGAPRDALKSFSSSSHYACKRDTHTARARLYLFRVMCRGQHGSSRTTHMSSTAIASYRHHSAADSRRSDGAFDRIFTNPAYVFFLKKKRRFAEIRQRIRTTRGSTRHPYLRFSMKTPPELHDFPSELRKAARNEKFLAPDTSTCEYALIAHVRGAL